MNYKIGHVDLDVSKRVHERLAFCKQYVLEFDGLAQMQKFVVTKEEDTLVFYAMNYDDRAVDGIKEHKDIVKKFGLENIVGGGFVGFGKDNQQWPTPNEHETPIVFYDKSRSYGGIPVPVMKGFAQLLLAEYQKALPMVTNVQVSTFRPDWDQSSDDQLQHWCKYQGNCSPEQFME
jgi:hypothetical protein